MAEGRWDSHGGDYISPIRRKPLSRCGILWNSKSYPRGVEMIPSFWMIRPFLFSHLSSLLVTTGMHLSILNLWTLLPCQILWTDGKTHTPVALSLWGSMLIARRPWLGIISRWRYWKILHWCLGSTHFTMFTSRCSSKHSSSNVTSTDMMVSAASWPCFKDFAQVDQVLIFFGSFLVDVCFAARSWTWLLQTRPFITLKQANREPS